MAALTPEVAQNLMYQAITGGVSNRELAKYGGYEAVNRAAQDAGFVPTPLWRAEYEQKQGMPESEVTKQNKIDYSPGGKYYDKNWDYGSYDGVNPGGGYFDTVPAGSGGTNTGTNTGGNTGTNTGTNTNATPFDGVSRDEFNALSTSFGTLRNQLVSLQTEYDKLVDRARRERSDSTGGIVGGSVVDDGSSLNPGQTSAGSSGIGTTGRVYGPDGKEYSSAAAALAAGVMDFTFARPQFGPGLIASADTLGSQFLMPKANTGNANPGANIANQNVQLFEMGAPKISLPGQIPNPFAATAKK